MSLLGLFLPPSHWPTAAGYTHFTNRLRKAFPHTSKTPKGPKTLAAQGSRDLYTQFTGPTTTTTTSTTATTSTTFKKGDKVKVNKGAKTYTGGGLASYVYNTTYDVIQVSGDRVVIGLGSAVTAAMNAKDLKKV